MGLLPGDARFVEGIPLETRHIEGVIWKLCSCWGLTYILDLDSGIVEDNLKTSARYQTVSLPEFKVMCGFLKRNLT